MPEDQIAIYTAANPDEAHLLRNMLEQRGIVATVTEDSSEQKDGEAQVTVSPSDASLAREGGSRICQ